jgi:hypothetical protein
MITLLMALGLLGAGLDGARLRNNEMIVGGGSCETDGMWISGPSLYLRRHAPGIVVGMVRLPRQERCYAYVLVIRGDPKRTVLAEFDGGSTSSGSAARSGGHVSIAKRKVSFEYETHLTGKVAAEDLLINGQRIDLSKGRVVLVDLSAEVTWRQIPVKLPGKPSWPTETADVETKAKELLGYLRRGDKERR